MKISYIIYVYINLNNHLQKYQNFYDLTDTVYQTKITDRDILTYCLFFHVCNVYHKKVIFILYVSAICLSQHASCAVTF